MRTGEEKGPSVLNGERSSDLARISPLLASFGKMMDCSGGPYIFRDSDFEKFGEESWRQGCCDNPGSGRENEGCGQRRTAPPPSNSFDSSVWKDS
ncbi:hypothetical protein TNIN_416631 [Trichonephila inaurata madagascariensis]|uniref:Uncharacterized protein n=1 Tax=Trichonephila inaurata madagascariensis TaxID=2747483 RepID=A0A8X6XPU1_9ARAC|nr:hypothetical protein TNIN_416631 [Trichonephila inaurata madagascariensis]